MGIKLPPLPYAHDALEPVMSAASIHYHHDVLQARYVAKVNAQARGGTSLVEIIRRARREQRWDLYNAAAQAWNHAAYWCSMAPSVTAPSDELAAAIASTFGSMDNLTFALRQAIMGVFGSGWAWLTASPHASRPGLRLFTTQDGDTVAGDRIPLLVCDVWEHAYYLDYPADRGAYADGWIHGLADWRWASSLYASRRLPPELR